MAQGMSRSFVIARAVAADQWLRRHLEISLERAPPEALQRYLGTLEPALRVRSWRALAAWGDEMMLRGTLERNAARALDLEIDLRDDDTPEPPPSADVQRRRAATRSRPKRASS